MRMKYGMFFQIGVRLLCTYCHVLQALLNHYVKVQGQVISQVNAVHTHMIVFSFISCAPSFSPPLSLPPSLLSPRSPLPRSPLSPFTSSLSLSLSKDDS